MGRECIKQNTKVAITITRKMKQTRNDIQKTKEKIIQLDKQGELIIPYLKTVFEKLLESNEELLKEISRYSYTYVAYEELMTVKEKAIWEEFFSVKKIYDKELSEFSSFKEKYKYFEPKNSEELKQQARVLLEKKGYIVDSPFEGDFERWIGVYARPKDKPTYLDPTDGEEVGLQEVYSVDGFKQDFAEWFEGEIVEGKVKEML
ncbi:Phi-29-like late activator [Enterococcus faecalis]|uniref:Phi-29-like late activator n=1 Tax=Enterococcus faecalis TaxID=1351 RepID=UPI001C5BE055|nr:Phi-29-like late activator [Enterococcus faecalis]MBW4169777.1 Phi-29-like late activator [Enterococcus faecalis]MBW4174867.1 Phi-29-like late activator [Enterococcus faecalis]MBW4177550.1 Phi-29-like late activator [Enterococcus faecalis]MCD5000727.1 Phi-29-like late activator [Enterococcus faecalis]MCD5268987.1 Phi-29-like late activator [Enterococcus faecalis]